MNDQSEILKLQKAIEALDAQRQSLGDDVVETALAPLRARLALLDSGARYEQRRLASVLFADLVGFTALSARLDPEDMRELLNTYFERCRGVIEAHGGAVEKFIGDAVMAVFGLHGSREDDPERAIRTGLEISRILAEMDRDRVPGLDALATRVGINTGEVVVGALGERQEGEFVVVGEAVNLASRLQAAAPPGGVLIAQDTYRHVRGVFEMQPLEPLPLKGVSVPVQVYLVKALKPRAFRTVRRGVEGVETSVVGREAELGRLKDAFHQITQSGSSRALTVVGEAGIGKSRLMEEFAEWLELLPGRVFYFKGRAYPAGQTTPYSLVRDMFAFRFQIQDSDPPSLVRQKLERGFARDLPALEGDENRLSAQAVNLLGRLIGFESGSSEHPPGVEVEARVLHDQALAYLKAYFRALAKLFPLAILLEDLHWADDSSLDLLQQLESSLAQVPLLLVGAARPGFFERRPRWGKDFQDHQLIDLEPLSTKDSYSLVQQILHQVDDLPGVLSDLIVNTAEGNPFYIEELVKMLIEEGTIQTGTARWRVELDRLAELRIPPTLVGVLQARLDRLPADERTYLQGGSVFGRIFWDEAVRYLEGVKGDAEPRFVELAGKLRTREMIFEHEVSTFENTREYMFKHALLRDVIYQSLLRRQRQAWHRLAARWLEQVTESSRRTDEFASLIASHNEQAGEHLLAAEWYWRAGQGAASRYANAEALHAFGRALELTPQEALDRRFEICLSREKVFELQGDREGQLGELEQLDALAGNSGEPGRKARVALRRAGYEFLLANFPGASASAQKAIALAQAVQAMEIAAEGNLLFAMVLIRQGDLDEARKHAQRSLDLARQHGPTKVEAGSLRHLGLIAYYMGRHKESLDQFAAALDLYIQIGDRQGESMAINNLGGAWFEIGDHAQAEVYYARSLELSREIGDRLGEGRSLNNLGITAVVRSDYARAEAYYLQSLQITRELGHRSFEISSLNNLSILALYRYQFSLAMTYQQEALQGARQIGDKVSQSSALINLGRNYWMMGDYKDAYRVSQQALDFYREIGDLQGECSALINLSLYHCAIEQGEEGREQAQQALELSRELSLREEEGGALHCLGEAALLLGEPQAAYACFQTSVEIRQEHGDAEVCSSQAGMARACLDLGDLEHALDLVAVLLEYWQANGILGFEQPIQAMLTCYQVLSAAGDPRAAEQLEKGYRLLQECAANIEDETLRQGFLRHVSTNRELLEIWNQKNG